MDDEFEPTRDPYRLRSLPTQLIWGSLRFILFAFVIIAFFIALALVYRQWQDAGAHNRIVIDRGSAELSATERFFLQTTLSLNADKLAKPVGNGDQEIGFIIGPGQNANQIVINLTTAGAINPGNESLLLNYLQFYGLDSQLAAGTYLVNPRYTIPELANVLTNPAGNANDATLRFVEGWRATQFADYLQEIPSAQIDPAQFLGIVERTVPFDLSPYTFLADLPSDASLEGFLFPDTYRISADATATDLINLLLSTFDQRVTPEMRQQFGLQGLSIREAVTLASIVEREAVLTEERPTIASVYYNRIAQGIKLDADPTVQYVVGRNSNTGRWWEPLTADDLRIDSPYNTYLYTGLTPSPIANPGSSALQAVASPAQTNYLFFFACTGDGENSHQFAETYDQHLANIEACP